jgi:hypothetical protein
MILSVIIDVWLGLVAFMVVAGIAFRFLPRKLPPVRLRKVAPSAAARLVRDFIASSYETDFGYPSGYFRVEEASDSKVVAREWVAKGSHFTMILGGFYRAILGIGTGFGCLGILLTPLLAVLVTPLLLYAAATETLLKYLLRSQIVTALCYDDNDTQVTFTVRGPSALLVGRRLERAFREPVPPDRIAALAGITVKGGTASAKAAA